MKQTEQNLSTLAILIAMDALDVALQREVPRLETGLDLAFAELKSARMAIAAPWSAEGPGRDVQVSDLCARIAALMGPGALGQLQGLAGAAVATEGTAGDPAEILRQAQRRTSGAIGAMLSALQVRDEMAQRLSHIETMLKDAKTLGAPTLPILSTLLGTQAQALIADLSERADKVAEKSAVATDAVRAAAGDGYADMIDQSVPIAAVIADAFGRAVSKQGEFDAAAWRSVIADVYMLAGPAEMPAGLRGRLADTMAAMALANASVQQIKIATVAVQSVTNTLPIDISGLDLDHPLLATSWQRYTVDAEREAHTRLVQRRQAA